LERELLQAVVKVLGIASVYCYNIIYCLHVHCVGMYMPTHITVCLWRIGRYEVPKITHFYCTFCH
jgi:hypothetical protein